MIQNRILDEIALRRKSEQLLGEALPAPNYLYIRKYGRNLAEDFEKIKDIGGYRDGFIFRVGGERTDSFIHLFQMEMEAHTQFGRKLQGLVLVELRDGIGEDERKPMKSLFLYLKELEPDINFLFSVEDSEDMAPIRQMLEQYFFIRTVEGENYNIGEQMQIIQNAFERYGFWMDEDGKKAFAEGLEGRTWEVDECVENKLSSLVKNYVFDKILREECSAQKGLRTIGIQEATEILRCLDEGEAHNAGRRVIGFAVEMK